MLTALDSDNHSNTNQRKRHVQRPDYSHPTQHQDSTLDLTWQVVYSILDASGSPGPCRHLLHKATKFLRARFRHVGQHVRLDIAFQNSYLSGIGHRKPILPQRVHWLQISNHRVRPGRSLALFSKNRKSSYNHRSDLYFLLKTDETFVDVLYGIEQKHGRMDYIGKSQIIRGFATIAGFSAPLINTGSLLFAIAVMTTLCFLTTLFYDLRHASRFKKIGTSLARERIIAL